MNTCQQQFICRDCTHSWEHAACKQGECQCGYEIRVAEDTQHAVWERISPVPPLHASGYRDEDLLVRERISCPRCNGTKVWRDSGFHAAEKRAKNSPLRKQITTALMALDGNVAAIDAIRALQKYWEERDYNDRDFHDEKFLSKERENATTGD